MAPTSHLRPGVVQAHTRQAAAIFDVGRWPGGADDVATEIAEAFRSSGFESVARPDIARWKYAKLLMNLGNPVDALCPRDDDARRLVTLAREEGERVLAAAGIDYVSDEEDRARRGDILRMAPINGQRREGGSTWQSLARGLPVEVDYLNGEIVVLGRLHGVPTPVNALLQRATHDAVAARTPPNSVPPAELLTTLGITA
jgi:2-dehydropantoate 2-reductase